MKADEFQRKIEEAYIEAVDPDPPGNRPPEWGAQRWFAEQAGVTPKRVNRWVRGVHPVDPAAIKVLEMLEERAGVDRG